MYVSGVSLSFSVTLFIIYFVLARLLKDELNTINALTENQKQANAQLITSLTNVADRFKALTEPHQQAVNTTGQTSQNMQQSASQLGMLSDNLNTTAMILVRSLIVQWLQHNRYQCIKIKA